MILAIFTLALIAALTSGTHNVLLLLLSAVLVAYCIALAAVLVHERKVGHVDFDLRMHPR